ncbi:MAG TPA: NfeD family protein [Mycobacteriales bacterium]|nr:NfeD family protein [Mycobacteriales bacterium]
MTTAAWIWFAVAVVLGLVEITTLTLAFAMVATGAAAAGVVAVLGGSGAVQSGVAAAVSAAGLLVVRPIVQKHLTAAGDVRTGIHAMVGHPAVVTAPVSSHGGQVRIGGELWQARLAFDDADSTELPLHTHVTVAGVDGTTVTVYPSDPLPKELA